MGVGTRSYVNVNSIGPIEKQANFKKTKTKPSLSFSIIRAIGKFRNCSYLPEKLVKQNEFKIFLKQLASNSVVKTYVKKCVRKSQ